MAFDISKLNFFSKMGPRARVAVLFGSVVGAIFLMYLGVQYMSGDTGSTGASSVAGAPRDLQSVPGGELTPEYYRALKDANAQASAQAKISGTSAIPTLINSGTDSPGLATGKCAVNCGEEDTNSKATLDAWAEKGEISPEVSASLQALADKNVSVEDYAAELDRLVKEGKLTPEQARKLLEQFKKKHAETQLKESAKVMDDMIKTGLPIETANQLLASQKKNLSPAEYAAELERLVREGKLSPAQARMLLAQYTMQKAKDVVNRSIGSLKEMGRNGQLTKEVETTLIDLENRMVPVEVYQDTLNKFISSGKLIPLIADKIIAEYKQQKSEIGPTGSVNKMLQEAEAAAYGEINDLLKAGKITQDVGIQLTDLIQKDAPLEEYKKVISDLQKQGKITPDIAKLKVGDYESVKGLREMSQKLSAMQGNNVTTTEYAATLKRAVQTGQLTPEQATQLLKEYETIKSSLSSSSLPISSVAGDASSPFAKLQQRLQQASEEQSGAGATGGGDVFAKDAPGGSGAADTGASAATEFTEAQLAEQQAKQEEQRRLAAEQMQKEKEQEQAAIESMAAAMQAQAQQLIASWQPPVMAQKQGSASEPGAGGKTGAAGAQGDAASGAATGKEGDDAASKPTLVKSGTIAFAVLDTTVNSDYPDSPVMATIVDGNMKGAKLMGKLTITKGVSGQQDRIMLNFTTMNRDEWPKQKSITAFAIDPDTARTALASQVDFHYLKRFGATLATSFLQGYASAITNAGTSTTGIFGTSTTNPALSPSQKIYTALGKMGEVLGKATENYTNTPPTVTVNSGVGLGILFMADVT